jgi:hypothetical protein
MWVELAAVRLCPANPGRVRDTPAANRLGQAGARLDTGPLAVAVGCRAEARPNASDELSPAGAYLSAAVVELVSR